MQSRRPDVEGLLAWLGSNRARGAYDSGARASSPEAHAGSQASAESGTFPGTARAPTPAQRTVLQVTSSYLIGAIGDPPYVEEGLGGLKEETTIESIVRTKKQRTHEVGLSMLPPSLRSDPIRSGQIRADEIRSSSNTDPGTRNTMPESNALVHSSPSCWKSSRRGRLQELD
ncbi:hypothetical protein BP5796_07861 [Coleophoma crateriformis]|uniref:Uncharacterized protein n=1 Tax=Coleophoma crateriformis TaxID=565419 RepID=A0A3D8RCP6_9HELO|nr:hypothetical protein BP5796_07861 [Coleophoma crateriformis]